MKSKKKNESVDNKVKDFDKTREWRKDMDLKSGRGFKIYKECSNGFWFSIIRTSIKLTNVSWTLVLVTDTENKGSIPKREHEKSLLYPRVAAGAKITQ
jgi:hypothetical protein